MDVVVTVDGDELRITDIHPIALRDAIDLAVDAAARLNTRLAHT